MKTRQRDWVLFGVLWVVFVVIGEYLAFGVELLPAPRSDTAEVVDEAYKLLIGLAVPVFALVAAMLLTMIIAHGGWKLDRPEDHAAPTEDGEPVRTHKVLVPAWVLISAALAIGVAINPGFIGLRDVRGESSADLVVRVQAQRWSWSFTYPDGQVVTDELVLPVDERVRFDVTSIDVLHSFWIPAFRVKMDAVPGRTTKLRVTPEDVGDTEEDSNLRVQCAEFCGVSHWSMATPIRVVEKAEFDEWLASQSKGA